MKHPTPTEFYENMVDKEESFDICFPGRDEDERLWPSAARAEFENQMKRGYYPKGTTLDDIIDATEYSVQVTYHHIDDVLRTIPEDCSTARDNLTCLNYHVPWRMANVLGTLEVSVWNMSLYDDLETWKQADPKEWNLYIRQSWEYGSPETEYEQFPVVAELHELFRKDVDDWLNSEQPQGTLWKCEIYYTGNPDNRYTTDPTAGGSNSGILYKGCNTIPGGWAIINDGWIYDGKVDKWVYNQDDPSIRRIIEDPTTHWKLTDLYDYQAVRRFALLSHLTVFQIPEWVEIKKRYLDCDMFLMGSHYATLADKVVYGNCALAVNALGKLLDKWNWWNGECYQFGLDGENDDANCLYNINVWHDYDPESDEYEECEEIGYTYTSDHQYDNLLTCDGELPEDFYYVYRDLVKDLSPEHVNAMGDWLSKYDCIDVSRCRDGWAYRVDHQLVIYETKHEDGASTYRLAVEEMEE